MTAMFEAVPDEYMDKLALLTKATPLAAFREGVDSEEVRERWKKLGGRPAYEEEIAGVVGMICGEEAGWCTGSVVCANGGMRFSV